VDERAPLWAALLDHARVGAFALDARGRVVVWTAEAERLTARTSSEVLGADGVVVGIAPPDEAAGWETTADAQAGATWSGTLPSTSEHDRPVSYRCHPVHADGRFLGVVGILSDESGSPDSSDETLALLDGLFENAPVGFTYVDTDLRYRRVNATVASINGGTVEERIGRTIDEVHGEPCGPRFSAVCREVIRTGEAQRVRIEGRLWHGRGPHQVWRMNYYPVFGAGGEVVGVGDVFVDVTEAETTGRELTELAAARLRTVTRYRSLIEATSAEVWTVTADGDPVPDPDASAADRPPFLTRVHPHDREDAERRWREALDTGSVFDEVARLAVEGGGHRHFRIRAVPVVVAGRTVEWVGTETDIDAEVRARTRLELLARATEAVNRELEPLSELQALVDVLVPTFADGCTVHLLDPLVAGGPVTGRRLTSRVDIEVPDASAEPFTYADDHPFAELVRTRRPLLLHHPLDDRARWARDTALADWERRLGWHTSLLTPIRSGDAVIAALTFVAWGDRPRFTDEDLTFVSELAARASVAIEHAQRFQETRRAALTLQKAMLSELPPRRDVEIQARYQPALDTLEVGGDWYDAFTLPGGDLGLVVGDVVGHDLDAATVMGQLRSMFRGIAMDDSMEPARAVERLDELAVALGITDFASLLYARLRPRPDGGATLTWSSAGHPAPLLVHPAHGPRSLLEGAGMVLGVTTRGPSRSQGRATIEPGSTLLLYTDGLVEQRRRDLDETTSRLEAVASELLDTPLATFCDELLARSESDTSDDIALLAVRLPDALPAAPPVRPGRSGQTQHRPPEVVGSGAVRSRS
jgi:PAS domain S-box-containing protein